MEEAEIPSFCYRVSGWVLRSSRRLTFLTPAAPVEPDVEIRFGPFAAPSSPCILRTRGVILHACTAGFLEPSGKIRIRVDAGRTLSVDVGRDVSDAELHTWLFGPAFGVLSHQRGAVPLHASALQVGGTAVVIAGYSGAGKSTTARALIHRGHRLLADDQVIIDPDRLLVYPGFPAMKLWARSAAALGDKLRAEMPVLPSLEKFHIPSAEVFQLEPVAAGMIVILSADPEREQPGMQKLAPAKAAAVLTRYVYQRPVGAALGRTGEMLRWAARLCARVPVYHLRRLDSLNQLDDLVALIERAASKRTTSVRESSHVQHG